ncbi:MAG: hypothetical protein V3V99_08640 [candidate division Zixibacteria bacterium]
MTKFSVKSLAKLRDSRKGITSPTAKKQASACRNHHRFDMTKNVNLRKQTHFYRAGVDTCTAPNTINMMWIHRATAENRLSPEKGQNEPNSL